ncbi:MAG: Gfo/Idh/MocA family oxidoreductase [Alphaproteobacteria bacterium]|nr:Gfo/Idh/MocA family oxidoreductase [Alphaproteobacteria bacterium]
MSTITGVGIIGCGNISTSYLRLAPLFKGIEVRAVADIAPEAARVRAEEYGVRAQGVDDLLANPEIGVVVNLTIPEVHYAVTKSILSAGKHAYSEKPMVLTLEDGLDLQKIARERNLRIGSAPDTFLGGAHQKARALIDAGALGRITSGTAHVMGKGMEHWHPNPDFFFRPGGGPILDMGPYYITNLINLVGPVKRVAAFANAARKQRTIAAGARTGEKVPVMIPTNIHAVMEFHSGAVITLGASWDVYGHDHAPMELYGTGGAIFVPDPNFFGGDVITVDPDGKREIVAPWSHPLGVPNQERPNGQPAIANYRSAGFADMVQAIAEGRAQRCSFEMALHVIDVMTSILRAAETGSVVDLTTTCERPMPLSPDAARALLK